MYTYIYIYVIVIGNQIQEYHHTEAATDGVLLKKVFLKISQNVQENTSARVSF